jgi:hypothetical protein
MSARASSSDHSMMNMIDIEEHIRLGHRLRSEYIAATSKHVYDRLSEAFTQALRGESLPSGSVQAR